MMKEVPAFNLNFYEFICDDFLTENVLSKVKQIPWTNNHHNKVSKDDNFYDEKLFEWFDSCLNQVREKVGLPNNITLPITECWANKTNKIEAHHQHYHSNSFISGVFYLTSHNSSPTIFSHSDFYLTHWNQFSFEKRKSGSLFYKSFPVRGKLILFPSQIPHFVSGLVGNEERYTIAFNTFFEGHIDRDYHRTRLYLKTKSVREIMNET